MGLAGLPVRPDRPNNPPLVVDFVHPKYLLTIVWFADLLVHAVPRGAKAHGGRCWWAYRAGESGSCGRDEGSWQEVYSPCESLVGVLGLLCIAAVCMLLAGVGPLGLLDPLLPTPGCLLLSGWQG